MAYRVDGDRITVEIERIANNTSDTTTGSLYVTVWMSPDGDLYGGGYRAAQHRITGDTDGSLGPGRHFRDIRWTLDYRAVPGTYYVHFFTSQHPNPYTVLDSYTFANTIERTVVQHLDSFVDEGKSPGLWAAVIDEGGSEVATAGVRRQGSPNKLTANDLIHIGSNTKAMTATMLATLVADGTFVNGWQTTIAGVFPELSNEMHPDYRFVTLRQLVGMAGGAPRNAQNWWAHNDSPTTIRRSRYLIMRENLALAPEGTAGEYLYSNLSYLFAGAMAERATGRSWETLMRTRLFSPLGISAAGFGAPGSAGLVDQPWGHRRDSESGEWVPAQLDNSPALGPAGTVHITMQDWAKFIRLWFPGIEPAILDRSRLDELISPIAGHYASGWFVVTRSWAGEAGGLALSHNGSNTYWNTHLWVAPELGRAFIAAANSWDDDTHSMLDGIVFDLVTYAASTSGSPDLVVESPTVSVSEIAPGGQFVLAATVRNRGSAQSAASTVGYYRQRSDGTRTLLGEQSIAALDPSATQAVELRVNAEAAAGTYTYSVCVASVAGESDTSNNCSSSVSVVVQPPPDSGVPAASERVLGDFDGDGRADVLLRHADGRWFFYPMNGRQHSSGEGTANLTQNLEWTVAGVGDLNGDGKDDVLLRKPTTGTWYYYPMNGRRHLTGHGAADLPNDLAWSMAGIGDFDGNGRDDVLLRHDDGRWYFYPMAGRRQATGHGTANLTQNLEWDVAGIGDLNGDGKDDVLLRKPTTGTWYYYPMNGRRHLAGHGAVNLPSDLAWSLAGIGDFDGNGRDDVLLRHDDGRWYFHAMDGRRQATGHGAANLTRNLEWDVAGIGDLNGDGKDDVLLRKPTTGTWYYYPMNGRRHLTGHGASNLTSDLDWALASAGASAGGLRVSASVRSSVQPFQSIALNVGGGANGAEYDIMIDLSGTGSFEAEHTIEALPVKAARGGLLMAAPLPETLAEGNTARRFAVRVRERGDETMSNTLSFTLDETNVPPSLAGHPTVILDMVLKGAYEASGDPLLAVEAGAIEPGRSVHGARALGLSTAFSDAQAAALLRQLFDTELVEPVASGARSGSSRFTTAIRHRSTSVRCLVPAACDAIARLVDCAGDAMQTLRDDRLERCARREGENLYEAFFDFSDKINSIGNLMGRLAPRVARFLGLGRRPAQTVHDINAAVRQGVGLNKTLRTITEDAEALRQSFEAMRDTTRTLTEDLPDHIAAAEQEAVADGVDDDERDAHFALVEEADHHQGDAAAIELLEDVYTGEADVAETLRTGIDGESAGCGSNYEEFRVDDRVSTCVWRSLVEWNCYAGSRHVSHPDLGGANPCLYYSLDYFQPDGTCRENYAKVRFQGRDTCRWGELGSFRVPWYILEKENGVASPQASLCANGVCTPVGAAVTITLTWGANPRDLDSHLWGPDRMGGDFHVYYGNRIAVIEGATFELYADDTDGFGPEVIAISSFPMEGRYRYAVRRFAGNGSIATSGARVQLSFENGSVLTYSAESMTGTGDDWAVFNIEVDADLIPRVVEVQSFGDTGAASVNRLARTKMPEGNDTVR